MRAPLRRPQPSLSVGCTLPDFSHASCLSYTCLCFWVGVVPLFCVIARLHCSLPFLVCVGTLCLLPRLPALPSSVHARECAHAVHKSSAHTQTRGSSLFPVTLHSVRARAKGYIHTYIHSCFSSVRAHVRPHACEAHWYQRLPRSLFSFVVGPFRPASNAKHSIYLSVGEPTLAAPPANNQETSERTAYTTTNGREKRRRDTHKHSCRSVTCFL